MSLNDGHSTWKAHDLIYQEWNTKDRNSESSLISSVPFVTKCKHKVFQFHGFLKNSTSTINLIFQNIRVSTAWVFKLQCIIIQINDVIMKIWIQKECCSTQSYHKTFENITWKLDMARTAVEQHLLNWFNPSCHFPQRKNHLKTAEDTDDRTTSCK